MGREVQYRACNLIWAAWEGNEASDVHAIFMCWRFSVTHSRLQQKLEETFTQQQDFKDACSRSREDLVQTLSDHKHEQAEWSEQRASYVERIEALRSIREETGSLFAEMSANHDAAHLQESNAIRESQALVDELASMKSQTLEALDQLQMAEGSCELAAAEMRQKEAMVEEECTGIQLNVSQLQQEMMKQ